MQPCRLDIRFVGSGSFS